MKRGFVLHHNGPPASCIGKPHTRCVAFWAAVKAYHQAKWPNSNDIAYSFGVCPHGTRFVGRGWDKNQYAGGTDVVGTDDGPDSAWYSVLAFVGGDDSTHDTEAPTQEMVRGVAELIVEGRSSGRCGSRVLPHSAFKPKPCPGPQFTVYAHQWDNHPLTLPEDDMAITDEDVAKVAAAVDKRIGAEGSAARTGLHEMLYTHIGASTDKLHQAVAATVRSALPVDAFADAVVAKLPAGTVGPEIVELVKGAVTEVLTGLVQVGHFEAAG